jgi:T4 bacteriophage base plate protein
MTNPLSGYFRQPAIYLKLPSGGKGYPEGSLDLPLNGQIPVYPMTARDEITLKTPDALLNGEATTQVIASCVPNIRDPWAMPSMDIDSVLIAIRIASYGTDLELEPTCPHCGHENSFSVNLTNILDSQQHGAMQDHVQLSNGLVALLRPMDYRGVNQMAYKAFEEQRLISQINDAVMSDEDKIKMFTRSLIKMSSINLDMVITCVVAVQTPQGTVSDPEHIGEWLNNITSDDFDTIRNVIESSSRKMKDRPFRATCVSCSGEWDIPIELDQSNFFGSRS